MSKSSSPWWGYVRNMIRQYPDLRAQYDDLHTQKTTPAYSGMSGGGGVSRETESVAIRELPATKQREFEAVRMALACSDAATVQLVRLVYWSYRRYYIHGAAMMIGVSDRTAKRMHKKFILMVAGFYGLLDGD